MPERLPIMTSNTKRQPIFTTDETGNPVAYVQLAKERGCALIDAADLKTLEAQGFTLNWTWNVSGGGYGYVRAQSPRNLVTVARQIMQPPPGHQVRCRNGDRRDLRRSNLIVVRRGKASSTSTTVTA